MPTLQCVSREALKEYLWGWTDADQSSAIESHLTECEECERTVAELESDPERLVESIPDSCDSRNSRTDESHRSTSGEESMPAEDAVENSAIARAMLQAKELRLGDEEPLPRWQPPAGDFGPYELLRPLGHGGMASVYLARHRQLGKQVAIKLLPSRPFRNDHYAARFQREIRTAGQLNHPAIVSATDAGEYAGTHFLVMEYIEGLDLSRVARLHGPLPIADACKIMQIVAIGLSHAHAEGIVHRDIKPSNLMLSQNGEVKILDFGLAQVSLWDEVSAELTTVGQLMGTLDYMAPEQAERPEGVDYRADLYSIGATLFRLLCGRAPLAAAPDLSPLVKLRLLASHQPPRLDTLRSDAPEELVEFVGQLLARDPGQRPASAAHVAEQLSLFAQGANLKSLIADAMAADVATDVATENRVHSGLSVKRTGAVPAQVTEQVADAVSKTHGSGRAGSRFGWWLVASLLPLFILGGVLITLETQKGQLVIESSADNVEVKLLREGEFYETLQIQPGANATRLYAGKYEVIVAESSDAVTFDRSTIEIKRGETVVARVTTPSVAVTPDAPESQATVNSRLPSSTRKLQVNDQIVVISATDPKMNSRVVVMSDLTIKLPWVGIVSVESESLDSLQAKLRERYAKFIREPMIDVYFGESIQPNENKFVIDTAAASSGVPPRNDAVLQPGDALTILNGNDTSESNRAVVLADSTLRLPLIGTFSVASETITTLERKLNELYKPYYREPRFEVFRAIYAARIQSPLASMNSGAKASIPAELLYEGKTLAEWSELFLHERSPAELEKAIAAMAALRTSGDGAMLINDTLLRALPTMSLRVTTLLSAFSLLYKTQDNSAAYFQLLADQLRTGNAQWRESILTYAIDANRAAIADHAFASSFEPMRKWIVENVLQVNHSPDLAKSVVKAFSSAVIDSNATAECKRTLIDTLAASPVVGLDFWLGSLDMLETNEVFQILNRPPPELAAAIEAKAIEALGSDETPSKYVIQAARVLMQFNKSEFDRTGMPPRPDQKVFANAVAKQIQRVLDEPARLAEKVKLDDRFQREALPFSVGNLVNEKLTLLVASRCSVRSGNGESLSVERTRSYVLFQLFDLISDFKLQDELESAFTRIIELTRSEAIEFATRIEQPFRSGPNSRPAMQFPQLPIILVEWPNLSPLVTNSNSVLRNEAPTDTQCIHYLLLDRCCKLLPEGEARNLLLKNLQNLYERNYVEKVIEKMDRNEDGKLSLEEAATDSKTLRYLPVGDAAPAEMDVDQDTFLSVDELLAAIADFASKVPAAKDAPALEEAQLAWATRQIERYDKNKDQRLSEQEWSAMLVPPVEADVDKDGFITVEEYANFRAKSR